jgi:hypothetical protein
MIKQENILILNMIEKIQLLKGKLIRNGINLRNKTKFFRMSIIKIKLI